MKLQAAIAKGHPEDAVSGYKKTLSSLIVEEGQLRPALGVPEQGFVLRTVEQLVQLEEQDQ